MLLLEYLLRLFDVEEVYEELEDCRERYKAGCKGLRAGGNPTVMDFIDLSMGIWNSDAKYSL